MASKASEVRVFLDANILIAGSVWPRWPYEVLQGALNGDYQLVLNSYVIEETRRTLAARFSNEIGRFEAFLTECHHETVPLPTLEAVNAHAYLVRDIADVPIVLSAIEAGVDFLVSEDKDLTTRDESTTELRQHVNILLSGTFLREVMGWSSEQLEAVRGRTWKALAS